MNRARRFHNGDLIGDIYLASKEQLRVLLSILIVAIIGLIPAAILSGVGSDVQRTCYYWWVEK